MGQQEVFDFHRIFFGDLPYGFLLEVVFRTVVMYAYTILLLRFLGKRSMGQLSTLELAIIICFGSAVGDPMMGVDIPITHGLVVITTVALLQVVMEYLINRNKKLEAFMEGRPDCLVRNGLIEVESLDRNNLSHEDLYRFLRGKDIVHLGEIRHAFFETSGLISVWCYSRKDITPGLGIMPDEHIPKGDFLYKGQKTNVAHFYSCTRCGYTRFFKGNENFNSCRRCGRDEWIRSVVPQ
ncbi:YetF domain-containing protein [Flavobacterium sp. 38-13]|uniref:DUF421 domain-containing protein n=1 Tax=Flavobacterium sp. 38-13 TaxID=1896168 RepID=UPI00257AF674|nr:YetF domain-containing protein [Flavobacterium sp. 38-13]